MNYEQFLKSYDQNHIFYLYGEEDYFIENFINMAKSQLNADFRDFNYDLIDLSNTDYDACLIRLRSIPMMDSHKVVVIKNFSLRENKECIWSKEEKQEFPSFLKNLSKDIKVIVVASINDKSTKIFKAISEISTVFESARLDHISLTKHVLSQVKLHKQTMEIALAEYYVSICGYLNRESTKSINEVNKEISKLCNFISSGGFLTKEAIEEMVVKTDDYNIFALLDSSLKGDRAKSLSLYEILLKNDTHPMMVFSMLSSSIGLLSKCKLLGEKGMSIDMIAKELKENPFRVKNIVNNARRFTKKSAILLLNDLNDLDYKYKTGLLTDNVVGQLAIMRITK